MYPKILLSLIEELKKLPGVGAKTAERYAFEIINRDHQDIEAFANALLKIKDKLKACTICGNITEDMLCDICKDKHRDRSVICVVSHPKDIIAMEKMGEFHGVYHVLNGVISTFKGILPEDINIETLIQRVDEHVSEVIIATNPTIEGETTALYLAKKLQHKGANVTRLASGLPMGGHLDYADEMTLIKALEGRKKI
jgi:recombination protein RecR